MGMVTTGIGGTQDGIICIMMAKSTGLIHGIGLSLVGCGLRTNGITGRWTVGDFNNREGFFAEAKRASTLVWWVNGQFIKQVALANEVFTPSSEAIQEAKEIKAMNKAAENGEGATVFKGQMVDIASIKQAEVLVKLAFIEREL